MEAIEGSRPSTAGSSSTVQRVRDIRTDGTIANSELVHRGFVVGAKIVKIDQTDDDWVYTIIKYDMAELAITIQAKAEGEDEEDDAEFEVQRVDLIKEYKVAPREELEVSVYHHFMNA